VRSEWSDTVSICSTAAPKLPSGMKPLTVRLNAAKALLGIGTTKFYELVNAGKITIIKIDGMPLAEYASLEKLIEAGAQSQPAKSGKRAVA